METKNDFPLTKTPALYLFSVVNALILSLRIYPRKHYPIWQEITVILILMFFSTTLTESLWRRAKQWHVFLQNTFVIYVSFLVGTLFSIWFGMILIIMFDPVQTFLFTGFYSLYILMPTSFILVHAIYNKIK